MATPIIMPRQGQSVESCIIGEWYKKVGDSVQAGEALFSYETDKSAFEETAKEAGQLLAIFFGEGEDVPCLTTVAVIGAEGESVAAFQPGSIAAVEGTESVERSHPDALPAADAPEHRITDISPRAKATAQRMCLDAANAAPSGPNGRVIERDILALAGNRLEEPVKKSALLPSDSSDSSNSSNSSDVVDKADYADVPMSNLRRLIAANMHESLASMAQLTHNTSFDATAILAYRERLKGAPESMGLPKITINDILLFATAQVLMKFDYMNAHCLNDTIRHFSHVNLGVAIDTPRGLLVPTLFHADTKCLSQIAREVKTLTAAAQEGKISPDLLTGGTFTVTNLGSLGIEHFTPVINPPQVGILGVDCITDRVRVKDGKLSAYPAMGLSLTYDHRAVDGAPASRFLKELVTALENFDVLLAQ